MYNNSSSSYELKTDKFDSSVGQCLYVPCKIRRDLCKMITRYISTLLYSNIIVNISSARNICDKY